MTATEIIGAAGFYLAAGFAFAGLCRFVKPGQVAVVVTLWPLLLAHGVGANLGSPK